MIQISLQRWCAAAAAIVATVFAGVWMLRSESPKRGLPFHDRFEALGLQGWRTQGGEWSTAGNVVVNNSNEMGSRLLTGWETLTDYRMDADIRLTNSYGDAGLVVRVSDSEEGTNSFYGYYAGLRLPDLLILSRMDYGYQPLQVVKLSTPISPRSWYHLAVQARSCTIEVRAMDSRGSLLATAIATDKAECLPRGSFGLRSFAAGGSWRNVLVRGPL